MRQGAIECLSFYQVTILILKRKKSISRLMGLMPEQMKYVQFFAKFLLISEINLKLSKIRCLLQHCVGKILAARLSQS